VLTEGEIERLQRPAHLLRELLDRRATADRPLLGKAAGALQRVRRPPHVLRHVHPPLVVSGRSLWSAESRPQGSPCAPASFDPANRGAVASPRLPQTPKEFDG